MHMYISKFYCSSIQRSMARKRKNYSLLQASINGTSVLKYNNHTENNPTFKTFSKQVAVWNGIFHLEVKVNFCVLLFSFVTCKTYV